MLRKTVVLAFSAAVLLLPTTAAHASNYYFSNDSKDIHITTTDGKPIYATGDAITLETKTDSDVFAAGAKVNINNDVAGNIFIVGNQLSIAAPISRSARMAGQDIAIHSNIDQDVTIAAATAAVEKNVTIGGDMHVVGSKLVIDGHVKGSVFYAGRELIVNGTIDGDISATFEKATFSDTAMVAGKLNYRSKDQATIVPGVVRGTINWTQARDYYRTGTTPYSIISSFLIGLLLLFLFRYKIERVAADAPKNALANLGYGLLFLIATPIVLFLLTLTIIGASVAMWLAGIYLLFIAIVSTLAALVVGEQILKLMKAQPSPQLRYVLSLVVGIVAMVILGMVPVIGQLAKGIIVLLVAGAFLREDMIIWHKLRKERTV